MRRVIGKFQREGQFQKPKFLKENIKQTRNLRRGWGGVGGGRRGGTHTEKPSVGGVWIFSAATQWPPIR